MIPTIEDNIPSDFERLADFECPDRFWAQYGYDGPARYVAIWYEACPGGAAYDDGRPFVGADADAFWELLDWNECASDALGNERLIATHYLIIDRNNPSAWLAPAESAAQFVSAQWNRYCGAKEEIHV